MALNRDDKCSGVVFANNTLYYRATQKIAN